MNRLKAKILNHFKLFWLTTKYSKLQVGKNVRIDFKSNIVIQNNHLKIADHVYLRSNPKGYHAGMPFGTTILIDREGAICEIGANSRINGVYIHAQKKIIIGQNTVIASGVNIIDSNGHITNSFDRTVGRDIPEEIVIGDNVWIGLNAIILKGSQIGKNSIISAGSVVQGKFPENSLIVGNPGKLVKHLDITRDECENISIKHN